MNPEFDPMDLTAMAWGELSLYELSDGEHIWGREVQLLPSGSMFGAGDVLHGLIGVPAEPIGDNRCHIDAYASLVIYGLRGTDSEELEQYQDELADRFNAQQLSHEV